MVFYYAYTVLREKKSCKEGITALLHENRAVDVQRRWRKLITLSFLEITLYTESQNR